MIYTLTSPVTVGDFHNPITITSLQLASISLNFDPTMSVTTAILSIVLVHVASGYKITIVYDDATAMTFWNTLNTANSVVTQVFNKLTADGKLPAGTLA